MFFAINRRRWLFRSGESRLRRAAFTGIFFAIERPNMRWILVEIRSPDPKFFFVCVDPLPQDFTPRASLGTRLALHAHEIGRKPMAIAAAAAPSMVLAVRRSLVAVCELLPVIVAESAGYARRQSSLVHRAKRIIQFRSEVPIHASDHVVLQRHAGFLRGFRILPPEVLGNVLRQSFVDGPRLALVLDLHLDPLLHLDGVDLWRPLVQRPEILVDADVRLRARIESFGAYGRPGGVLHRIGWTHRCEKQGWRGWPRQRRRVGQSDAAVRDIGNGDTMLAQRYCSGCVGVFGAGGCGCYLDRRSPLDAE